MPAIYKAYTLQKIYELWLQDKTRKEIADELRIDYDDIDGYMAAALRKYSAPALQYKGLRRTPQKLDHLPLFKYEPPEPKKIQRPPAVYSNKRYV